MDTVDEMMEYIFPDMPDNEDLVSMVRRALEDTNVAGTSREDILNWLIAEEAPAAKSGHITRRETTYCTFSSPRHSRTTASGGTLRARD